MTSRLGALRVLICVALFVAAFLVTFAGASASSTPGRRLGLRGLKRQRMIAKNETWASLEPVVRWLGLRLDGLLSEGVRATLNYKIGIAGDFMGLLPEEFVAFSLVTSVLGFVVGLVAGAVSGFGNTLAIMCTAFGAIAPWMTMSSASVDRFKNVNRRLPYAIDLLALAMGAGLDFPGAVRQVVEKSGSPDDPLVEEFTLILQGLQIGRTRRQTLESFAARVPSDAVNEFVAAVVQAELRGNPVAQVLRIQAEVSRQRRSVRAEEAASKAGVAMVGPLMLVFLCILLLIVGPMALTLQKGGI